MSHVLSPSLTHSLTHSRIHFLTLFLTPSLPPSLPHLLTPSLPHSLTLLLHSLTPSPPHPLIHSLAPSLPPSLPQDVLTLRRSMGLLYHVSSVKWSVLSTNPTTSREKYTHSTITRIYTALCVYLYILCHFCSEHSRKHILRHTLK